MESKTPVLADMTAGEAAAILAACGDAARAEALRRVDPGERLADVLASGALEARPYDVSSQHQFGYIGPASSDNPWYIQDAAKVPADPSLAGKKIVVTLDKFRVYDYPGHGVHQILVDFSANQAAGRDDNRVHFSQMYSVAEGEGAGVSGYPIFANLAVPGSGVNFACTTVNVSNDDDQAILSFLKGDVFQQGLNLINGLSPTLPVVTNFVTGIVNAYASRHQNVKVQEFFLGLDFSDSSTHSKLRVGSYVAAQAPDGAINWGRWGWWDGMIKKWDKTGYLPYNYIVFNVSLAA